LLCPTRAYENVSVGLPVLRTDEYFIEDIISGAVGLTNTNAAEFLVQTLSIANQSVPAEDIDAAERFSQVRRIWTDRARLPHEIATLVYRHEQLVVAGNQVSIQGRGLYFARPGMRHRGGVANRPELAALLAVFDCLLRVVRWVHNQKRPRPPDPADQFGGILRPANGRVCKSAGRRTEGRLVTHDGIAIRADCCVELAGAINPHQTVEAGLV
jgi:hypothetical protein